MRFKDYLTESGDSNVTFLVQIKYKSQNKIELGEIPIGEYERTQKAIEKIIKEKFDLEAVKFEFDYQLVEFQILNLPAKFAGDLNLTNEIRQRTVDTLLGFFPDLRLTHSFIRLTLDGLPRFKIFSGGNIYIHVKKAELSLAPAVKYINPKNIKVVFYIPDGWVGGVLSVLEMPNEEIKFVGGNHRGDLPWINIVKRYLKLPVHQRDKWDCQEELEKDKSTKPFASD
jgi:hypothetical protein